MTVDADRLRGAVGQQSSSGLRILFAYKSRRRATMLIAGDKAGNGIKLYQGEGLDFSRSPALHQLLTTLTFADIVCLTA